MSEDFLVVVYQFGKVASTALVNSLNTNKSVTAHQSHFLGEDALQRMIPNIVDVKVGAYFRRHMIGQLVNNLELTHQVNTCLKGQSDQKLVVISLSREPIDWFRSCIQQDIEGYLDDILRYDADSDAPSVQGGLERILSDLNAFVDLHGGSQAIVEVIRDNKTNSLFKGNEILRKDIARRMLLLAMRPLVWFDDHFARCFDFGLADMSPSKNHWLRQADNGSFVVLRYEDIEDELPEAMKTVGVPFKGPLCHANSSADKPWAQEIRNAFESKVAANLRQRILQSDYARHFRYDGANNALNAA